MISTKLPKVSAIQICSSDDVTANLAIASKLIAQAKQQGSQLVVLPEMFAIMNKSESDAICIYSKNRSITLGNISEKSRHRKFLLRHRQLPIRNSLKW